MLKLVVGWEEELKKQHNHSKYCTCGCKTMRKEIRSKIREITKMIARGEAIVVSKEEVKHVTYVERS